MTKEVSSVASRSGLSRIALFPPDLKPCSIDLSDNTNLWGAPPSAERVIREDATRSPARYPEPYSESLKDALSEYVGVDPSQIVVGCGSDDVLDSSIRAFGEPGERIVLPDPTFSMLPFFARANGLEISFVTLTADYDMDVERTLALDGKIVYVCSPGNPTGNVIPRKTIEAIVEGTRGLVIIDEAYFEFAGVTSVDLTKQCDRIVVVRTMSKALGLAGLRVGYGIAAPAVVTEIEKSRGPFKVSGTSERAAVAAVTKDVAWIQANAREAVECREKFAAALRDMGLGAIPSGSNFLCVPLLGAEQFADAMREHDIALKAFSKLPCAAGSTLAATGGDALRITMAPWPTMVKVLDAMKAVLAQRS
ncbi:MAG TPA: histidinol-phosphate transaminase [Gemmatimonadaceae bacterium]|jgi:histidinol-phosphate aminotransferase